MQDDDWYGPDAATFGDRLAAARDHARMTQDQLAKRLGVKLSTLQGWEEDRNEPRANRLQTLSGILNVSIVWLLTGEGEGVAGPGEEPAGVDLRALLADLRAVQAEMKQTAERVGRLEKRLRIALTEAGV